ncbi:MAG TPA: 50S ribosomal protein L18e, partial [Thermoplasmataceae archaeon]|nr:50S ribosomal protein L18e [Thermoplasmataceae archaeon]
FLKNTVDELLKISRESGSTFWRDIAERLVEGKHRLASTNLGKIEKLSSDGDTIVIPGTVLGSGYFNRKATLSSLRVSSSAFRKIKESGSTFKNLVDLARENPKGTNLKILR